MGGAAGMRGDRRSETGPHADGSRLRPLRPRAQVTLGLLVGVVLAAVLTGGGPLAAPGEPLAQADLGDSLPALLAVLLLTIVVHELGHLLAGRAAGLHPRLLHLGPLGLLRTPAGWRLQLGSDRLLGAQVLAVPDSPAGLRRRHATMIAGGPALHLLLALVLAVGARAVPGVWAGAVLAGTTGLVNFVPLTFAGGTWSDGRWLLAWLARPAQAAQRVAVSALQLAAVDGARPRLWDGRWVPVAAGPAARPGDRVALAGALLAYAWALDGGRMDEAARFVEQATQCAVGLPLQARDVARVELAFFLARFGGDLDGAEALLARLRVHPSPALVTELRRAEAAVHLAAGRRQQALDACQEALTGLVSGPGAPAGLLALRRDQVTAMRGEALGAPGGRRVADNG
jgi:hypothetical protein